MPDELFEEAKTLFAEHPDYTLLKPAMPEPRSLIHTYPFFKVQGAVFTFFVLLVSESTIGCSPDKRERSYSGNRWFLWLIESIGMRPSCKLATPHASFKFMPSTKSSRS